MTSHHIPLVVDTETDGLWAFGKDSDAASQQTHVCEIAALLANPQGEIIGKMDRLIRPEGWVFDDKGEAAKVNGLTHERLMDEGVPILQALEEYDALVDQCNLIVGYSLSFDQKGIRAEQRRAGRNDRYGERSTCDVMYPAKKITSRIEGHKNAKKLTDVFMALFEEEGQRAHTAMGDVEMTFNIYLFLLSEGMIKAKPQVSHR